VDAKDYVLAGSAHFTIAGKSERFTYRVRRKTGEDEARVVHFVHVLTGPDSYSYLGTIFDRGTYRHGKKSGISPDALSAKAFRWFWSHIDVLPETLTFYRSEKCCRCGRLLTTPDSVTAGIGPECANRI
jgi:hypothetical protein